MKISLIIFILIGQLSIAQNVLIDSCGLNTDSKLNKYESEYFSKTISKKYQDFDFANKKIAFASGNFGKTIISKKDYFDRWGRDYFNRNSNTYDILLILTPEEKAESGGFDAIIISWSKILVTGKDRQKIIKKLKNKKVG